MIDQLEDLLSQKYPTRDPDIESAWRKGLRRRRIKLTGSVIAAVAVAAAGVAVGVSAFEGTAVQKVTTAGQPAATPDSSVYAAGDCGTVYRVSPGASTLTPVATIRALSRPPFWPTGMVVDRERRTAYVADSNAVWPVNLLSGTVGKPISFEGTIETLNLSPDEGTLYVGIAAQASKSGHDSLVPVSLPSGRRDAPIDLPGVPIAVLTAPDASVAYVDIAEVWAGSHEQSHLVTPGRVAVVNLRRRSVSRQLTGTGSAGLDLVGLSPDGKLAYAYTSYTGSDIETVSTSSGQVLTTVPLPQAAQAISLNGFALAPDARTLYLLVWSASPDNQSAIFAVDLALGNVRLFAYLPGYGPDELTLTSNGDTLWFTQASVPAAVPDQLAGTPLPGGRTSVIADARGCTLAAINTPGRASRSPTGIDTGRH